MLSSSRTVIRSVLRVGFDRSRKSNEVFNLQRRFVRIIYGISGKGVSIFDP